MELYELEEVNKSTNIKGEWYRVFKEPCNGSFCIKCPFFENKICTQIPLHPKPPLFVSLFRSPDTNYSRFVVTR